MPRESSEQPKRLYTPDEVGDIIDVATRLQQIADPPIEAARITMDQLAGIAAELGLSEAALATAIGVGEKEANVAMAAQAERSRWFRHFGVYLIVISGLALIDLVSGGGFTFFFYPAIGWGMGVGIHALSAFRRS